MTYAWARPSCSGDEVRFGIGYRALLRAMTSPFVVTTFADVLV